jgi:aarF domain-containing kinase
MNQLLRRNYKRLGQLMICQLRRKVHLKRASTFSKSQFSRPVFIAMTAALVALHENDAAECLETSPNLQFASPTQIVLPNELPIESIPSTLIETLFHFLELWTRCLYLMFLYTPVLATAPFTLISNEWVETWWQLLRQTIQQSGPCAIKLAQWIATRPDLFPEELCQHFQELQSTFEVPHWKDIAPIFEKHYGHNWSSFIHFTPSSAAIISATSPVALASPYEILGAGCVAQVIKARIDNIEGEVALKIVHPHVKRRIQQDLTLLQTLVNSLEYWVPSLQQISLVESVQEFADMMLKQVDMHYEAKNLQRFHTNFQSTSSSSSLSTSFNSSNSTTISSTVPSLLSLTQTLSNRLFSTWNTKVQFPIPYLQYTNEDILVESYEHGILLRDFIAQSTVEERQLIGDIGLNAICKMVFLDNFIHADLHPGNIIVLHPTATPNPPHLPLKLSFIDVGLAVELHGQDQANLIELFDAVIQNDGYRVGTLMIERSRSKDKIQSPEQFAQSMQRIVQHVHQQGLKLADIGVGDLIQQVLTLCYQHQVKLESRYATVIIAMGIVEGLGRQLDPQVNILLKAAPYVMKAAADLYLIPKAANHADNNNNTCTTTTTTTNNNNNNNSPTGSTNTITAHKSLKTMSRQK